MIPRIRMATGAAVLLAVAGLVAGCGGDKSPGNPSPTSTRTTDAPSTPAATASTTASTGGGGLAQVQGTVLLLSFAGAQNGIYDLREGQLSLWYGNETFSFAQSAVVSPQGTRIAFIAVGDGDNGPLQVISGDGTYATLGPETLLSEFLPVWAPDGASVLAVDGPAWVRIAVPSGAVTPVNAPNGYTISKFSPDLGYALMADGSGAVAAHVDGSGATPVVPPAGKKFHRILSLSPNGHDVIADVEPPDFPGGDAARSYSANAIVDTRTGTVLAVPGGGTLTSGYYLANGDAILRVTAGGADTVLLVSPTGAVLSQQTVPPSAKDYGLIGYVPAG